MKKTYWMPVSSDIWQGRDDSEESPLAKRIFQTIIQEKEFVPEKYPEHIALLGFMCDEGVKLNKGRLGAKQAPDAIRKAMANYASHSIKPLIDFGNIICDGDDLSVSQYFFADHIKKCQSNKLKTLVLGGGHETAFAHGLGVYEAHPDLNIGVINFDAHLDIRTSKGTSSGTPFLQLSEYCNKNHRDFNYLCVGASRSANTEALIHTAEKLNIQILWDVFCNSAFFNDIIKEVNTFISKVDIIYLTFDLDVLPAANMHAVSAPNGFGVDPSLLMNVLINIVNSNKLYAADFVEYIPSLDEDMKCARMAARFAWQCFYEWKK